MTDSEAHTFGTALAYQWYTPWVWDFALWMLEQRGELENW